MHCKYSACHKTYVGHKNIFTSGRDYKIIAYILRGEFYGFILVKCKIYIFLMCLWFLYFLFLWKLMLIKIAYFLNCEINSAWLFYMICVDAI